jgi:hypothetical protein
MTPAKIVNEAGLKNLAMIAVADHNSAANASAVMKAAAKTGLLVIPGIEVTTAEEVHVIGLFAEINAALSMQELIYDHLLPGENDEELFGIQVEANEFDEVEGINNRLLIGATTLGLEDVVTAIHLRGGLAVAAHIDREAFSITSQLGFVPPDLNLDALEVSKHMSLGQAIRHFGEYERFPFYTASDAHDLEEIGSSPTLFRVRRSSMEELKKALRFEEGRKVIYDDSDDVKR